MQIASVLQIKIMGMENNNGENKINLNFTKTLLKSFKKIL